MKNKQVKFLAVLSLAGLAASALVACGKGNKKPEPIEADPLTGAVLADFANGEQETVFASDGWTNESVFNCRWNKEQVSYEDGAMKLRIAPNEEGSTETNDKYFGGEGRTHQYFGYGDFKVRMKPSNKAGTASTFFTCTGNYDTDEEGNPNPHDEIDIEFLGKDTTKVQFNYFVNGQGGHEFMYNLGFDASKEFHDYGYRWSKDSIIWFVDDTPVYQVKASESNPLPSTPGRILMNYWCGTPDAEGWMGKYENPGRESSDYAKVITSATPIGEIPTYTDVEVPTGESLPLEFVGSDCYTISQPEDKKSLKVTYTDMQGGEYGNVLAPATAGVGKTKFATTVKNNGTAKATIRINMQAEKKAGNTDCCNLSAGATNGVEVATDTNYGGSTFELDPGAETTVVVDYTSNGKQGKFKNVMFMIDSSIYQDTAKHSGDVSFSNFIFAGEETVVDQGDSGDTGDTLNSVKINDKDITFAANDYTLTYGEDNSVTATYSDIAGATYKNFEANVAEIAANHGEFKVKVKNNGTESVTVRFDMEATNTVTNATNAGGHKDAALSCEATNGCGAYTDTTWAGSTITIGAGVETEVTVHYTNKAAFGAVKTLKVFIDSSVYGDTATHSGNVKFSDFAFIGEDNWTDPNAGTGEGGETGGETGGVTATDHLTVNGSDLIFNQNDYALAYASDNSVTATYENVAGNSYKNFDADISTIALGKTTFSVKIKNNGSTSSTIRFDMEATNAVVAEGGSADGHKDCAISSSATVGGPYTDLVWAGTKITVEPGAETVLTINYSSNTARGAIKLLKVFIDSSQWDDATTHSGSVTFSELAFSGEETVDSGSEKTGAYIGDEKINFAANDYTLTEGNNSVTATYENVAGNSYKNFEANIASFAEGNNHFKTTIKNNGTENVRIRIDLEGTTAVVAEGGSAGGHKDCGFNSWAEGSVSCYTDTTWAGSTLVIAPGETVELNIQYSNDSARGPVQTLKVFVDSSQWDDSALHTGSVTFSSFAFVADVA